MVDVAVDVEEDPPAVLPLVGEGRQFADRQQVRMLEEKEGIVVGEAPAVADAVGYSIETPDHSFLSFSGSPPVKVRCSIPMLIQHLADDEIHQVLALSADAP